MGLVIFRWLRLAGFLDSAYVSGVAGSLAFLGSDSTLNQMDQTRLVMAGYANSGGPVFCSCSMVFSKAVWRDGLSFTA